MSNKIKYLLLFLVGSLLFFIISRFQHNAVNAGEYYYSTIARNSYTIFSGALLFVIGIGVGYFWKLNPFYAAFCLILIFPLITFYEGTVYRGSHNLLPFELVTFLFFAVPAIVGVYIGGFISKKMLSKQSVV